MYWINKIIWFCINPLNIGVGLVLLGYVLERFEKFERFEKLRKIGRWAVVFAIGWLVVWSMPITAYVLGWGIERQFVEVEPKDAPQGDVAVDFGGSFMRSWYAAELVKCGKVKAVIPSAENIDRVDVPLIRDLGVSDAQLLIENEARNTEENVKNAKRIWESRSFESKSNKGGLNSNIHCSTSTFDFDSQRPKVLVVSSAVHVPRCMLMMAKYWPEAEAIACPCDFQTTRTFEKGWKWSLLRPSLYSYIAAEAYLHEYIGYFGYKWLRK